MGHNGTGANAAATIYSIQYLRGAAAIAVFLFHISTRFDPAWGPAAPSVDFVGAAGVDLFFVISGFIMAMIVARPGAFDVRGFVLHRAARILPGYYLATSGVVLLAVVAPSMMSSNGLDLIKLVRSLIFLPMPDGSGSMAPLLLVGWTLNYEVFFYILVVAMAGLFGDRGLLRTVVFLGLLVIAGGLFHPVHPTLVFFTDPLLLEFAFGIFVWHLHNALAPDRHRVVSALAFGVGSLLLLSQVHRDPENLRVAVWGIPVALVLFGSLRTIRFRSRLLAAIGDWSYAFYLIHLFVVAGYMRLVMPRLYPYDLPWATHYVLMTVAGLAAAAVFHMLVERPANQFTVNWYSRRHRPGPDFVRPATANSESAGSGAAA